ncbi:DUF2071 domain-containing protein [Chitinophagaceae bacterium LB-8]|uniref:DUF2071 domain-containing protein n=1 Tax=Paraflavisolibacter caeni TaxID=2982496 RepID=A0A9X3B905_9BACT|nr:DUF2071 domain-containing protein [Paraflavisolibacter caeni]MCU7551495.1 DUF2071 domain-containing protein [Paraflavisolibacter caeni]
MAVSTFLTAEWRKLAIANYAVDKAVLEEFLPAGTELDIWQDNYYISLVGFMFLNTRLKGFSIPCHANFEEVNLRFYVRYQENGIWKRGVVFIKEIVPRPAITMVANRVYKENYQTMSMSHQWLLSESKLQVEYKWRKKSWNRFTVQADAIPLQITEGSEEEFITEHYWGYARINDTLTSQYEVKHPKWKIYQVNEYSIHVDFKDVYGTKFSFLTGQIPNSVMLAEGSAIEIIAGTRISCNMQKMSD